ncbi:MAG TPA: VOC family protein [Steroidobacteraceae bacterium]|jgi:catechol 2,3-dioxygenase-like lactoylglutathione lyase family enzyme|nr:VOC family protein [Steroidobacteraceae bacterium]
MTVQVEALDHVNVITADLAGSVRFYAELLDLEPRDGPPPLTHENARWMYDRSGRALVHINSLECPRAYDRAVTAGPTGALHHVALRCSGYEELRARLVRRGLEHRINVVSAIGLRQIFVLDPNQVLLELNFFGA